MFFRNYHRKKNLASTLAQVQPLIALIEEYSGLPADFWESPYVLGFFCGVIEDHMRLTYRDRLSYSDLIDTTRDALETISQIDGLHLFLRYDGFRNKKNDDYLLGFENGEIYQKYKSNWLYTEQTVDVVRKAKADVLVPADNATYRQRVMISLLEEIWVNAIRHRFPSIKSRIRLI